MNRKEYEELVRDVFLEKSIFLTYKFLFLDPSPIADKIITFFEVSGLDYDICFLSNPYRKHIIPDIDFSGDVPLHWSRITCFINEYITWVLNGNLPPDIFEHLLVNNQRELYDLIKLKDITDEDELNSEITKWRMTY